MADIEFVVRLDQETLQDLYDSRYVSPHIKKVFRSATPLPKGHGRLIDADYKVSSDGRTIDTVCGYMAPTIIEADKTESEG